MGSPDELELIALYIGNCMTAFSVYLSVTFAYLTASYFTGDKMNMFQAATLTGLYVFAALSCVGAIAVNLLILSELESAVSNASQLYLIINADAWNAYMCSVMTIGIVVSVYFLVNVRRKISR